MHDKRMDREHARNKCCQFRDAMDTCRVLAYQAGDRGDMERRRRCLIAASCAETRFLNWMDWAHGLEEKGFHRQE